MKKEILIRTEIIKNLIKHSKKWKYHEDVSIPQAILNEIEKIEKIVSQFVTVKEAELEKQLEFCKSLTKHNFKE